ncbi:unnamed protein product [Arctogadus glacialis]
MERTMKTRPRSSSRLLPPCSFREDEMMNSTDMPIGEFEEAVHNNVLPMLRTESDRDVSADYNGVNTQALNVAAGARLGPLHKAANTGRTLELHRCQESTGRFIGNSS